MSNFGTTYNLLSIKILTNIKEIIAGISLFSNTMHEKRGAGIALYPALCIFVDNYA
jgi:hypothetical protein